MRPYPNIEQEVALSLLLVGLFVGGQATYGLIGLSSTQEKTTPRSIGIEVKETCCLCEIVGCCEQ